MRVSPCSLASQPTHPPAPPAGVLQVEALAQLGGIVMIDPTEAAQQNNFFFGGVEGCRWRKPVVPGDVLVRAQHSLAAPMLPLPACCVVAVDVRGPLPMLIPFGECMGWLVMPRLPACSPACLQMMRVDVTKFNKRFGICKVRHTSCCRPARLLPACCSLLHSCLPTKLDLLHWFSLSTALAVPTVPPPPPCCR